MSSGVLVQAMSGAGGSYRSRSTEHRAGTASKPSAGSRSQEVDELQLDAQPERFRFPSSRRARDADFSTAVTSAPASASCCRFLPPGQTQRSASALPLTSRKQALRAGWPRYPAPTRHLPRSREGAGTGAGQAPHANQPRGQDNPAPGLAAQSAASERTVKSVGASWGMGYQLSLRSPPRHRRLPAAHEPVGASWLAAKRGRQGTLLAPVPDLAARTHLNHGPRNRAGALIRMGMSSRPDRRPRCRECRGRGSGLRPHAEDEHAPALWAAGTNCTLRGAWAIKASIVRR